MRCRSVTVSLLAVAVTASGCHSGEEPAAPKDLPTVRVQVMAASTLHEQLAIAGVLAPLPGHDVKVGALVQGRVERLFVAEGDHVKAGQVLAHIEAEPLAAHVADATAQGSDAEAQLTNARTRLFRSTKLWRDGIAPRQEVDDAQAQLVAAESATTRAHAVRGEAEVQLGRATLRAPIDGVVAAIFVPAGQPVEGNSTPVLEVADTRELDLRAALPAARSGNVRVGDGAHVSIDGVVVVGHVAAVAPLVDAATNTVMVRVRVANLDGRLRGGRYANGAIDGPAHTGMALLRAALLPGDGGSASQVAVVESDGTVGHRTVTVNDDGNLLDVRSGLSVGERVIIEGGYGLRDQQPVKIVP